MSGGRPTRASKSENWISLREPFSGKQGDRIAQRKSWSLGRSEIASNIWGRNFLIPMKAWLPKAAAHRYNCWLPPKGNRPNPNYDRVINPPAKPEDRGWKEWDDSIAAAKAVMEADASTNPIKAALYYYSPNAQKTLAWKDPMNNPVLPSWVFPENKVGDAKGADFEFYREPNARQHLEVLKRQRERKDWRETMKQLRRNPDRRDEC